MVRHPAFVSIIAALFVTACGGSSTPSGSENLPAAQTVVVVTAPSELEIAPGETVQLSARVTGTADVSVTWSVAEADGGSVDATGQYTAPAVEGTFHVLAATATSARSSGTSVVRVKKGAAPHPVAVSVAPSTVAVAPGSVTAFAATVTGSTVGSVTWKVQEASGC